LKSNNSSVLSATVSRRRELENMNEQESKRVYLDS
jgi:hypothetical protein